MWINNFGDVNVLSWGLIPKNDEATDESFMVFTTEADEDTELYVAVNTDRVWLKLRDEFGWHTYVGTSEKIERIALEKIYFGGC